MKIKVKESTVVRPAKDTPKHNLRLSNIDLVFPRAHTPLVYFYKPNGSPNFFEPTVLKSALSDVLVPYYPVAGRLGKDESGRFEIVCNGEGVLFVEAETESTFDEFGEDFSPRLEFQQLVPSVDYSGHISSYPFFLFQVTFFKCGGVCLGTALHHTLVDGFSALQFINALSDVSRGLSVTITPFIDRTILRGRDPPIPTFHHIEFDPPPSMNTPESDHDLQTPKSQPNIKIPTSTVIFKITPDQFNTLKAQSTNKDKISVRYSSYQILAAHVWRCATIARGLPDDQPTKFYASTDGRSRLNNPPLPPGYFGNAIFTATSIASAGDLRSRPLADTVEKVHCAVMRMGDDYLRSALDFLELQPDPTAFVRGAHSYRCPNLNVVSWMGLPIYDTDFGYGRPIHVSRAYYNVEGMTCILPRQIKDGSVSLVVCLEPHHMQVFEKIFYDFYKGAGQSSISPF